VSATKKEEVRKGRSKCKRKQTRKVGRHGGMIEEEGVDE